MVDAVNAAPCPVGSFSYGYARRPCARCPGSFTTAGPGTASKWQCGAPRRRRAPCFCRHCFAARQPAPACHFLNAPSTTPPLAACPPGYRYRDDAAVACGFGSYKPGVNFALACTPCAQGLTTATGTAASEAECVLARPGFRLAKSGATVTGAVACGPGLYSNGGDITACTACPEGTNTTSETSGSTQADCRAAPGYGAGTRAPQPAALHAARGLPALPLCQPSTRALVTANWLCAPQNPTGVDPGTGVVAICPIGSYKFALGAFECVSCGEGLTTAAPGSTSYDACCERLQGGARCAVVLAACAAASRGLWRLRARPSCVRAHALHPPPHPPTTHPPPTHHPPTTHPPPTHHPPAPRSHPCRLGRHR